MWQVKGFETKEEAKSFLRKHGGSMCWEERTPKRNTLTARGKDYLTAAGAVGLDTNKWKYIVQWRA